MKYVFKYSIFLFFYISNNMKKEVCGLSAIEKILQKYQNTRKIKSTPSDLVIRKKNPNNPYISSIAGQYLLNLSKYKKFTIYFWKTTDDVNKNPAIRDTLIEEETSIVDFTPFYKEKFYNVFQQYTTFLNKDSGIVDRYEECNFVVFLVDYVPYQGAAYPPKTLYYDPEFVDNKSVLYMDNSDLSNESISEGGQSYLTLIHEFGHAFGLHHPHDNGGDSKIMPGIATNRSSRFPGIAAFIQNTVFSTVMTYNDIVFFLPIDRIFGTNSIGYPQTIMPYDILALRWMYDIKGTSSSFINKYGIKIINPEKENSQSGIIVGKNQEITFGSNTDDSSFYFVNQNITFNNIEPLNYQYNRVLEKPWSFYTQDVCSSTSVLNFNNTNTSNIFIEKRSLKTDLTVNCLNNKILNLYIIDCKNNYCICGNKYTDKKTGKTMTINNKSGAKINVFFNK